MILWEDWYHNNYRNIHESYRYSKTRQLSHTCRRFRRVLLPVIYGSVCLKGSSKGAEAFFDLMPVYGHLCHQLAMRISGRGRDFCKLIDIIRRHRKNFPNLSTLELAIQLDDGNVVETYKAWRKWSPDTVQQPSAVKMTERELRSWKGLTKVLNGVKELRLHGFTLADAANGFQGAILSTVDDLLMQLEALGTFQAFAAMQLRATFPNVTGLTIPAAWCPHSTWVHQAFAGWRLQRLCIGHYPGRHMVTWGREPDSHEVHQGSPCQWAESLKVLIGIHATFLTSLTLSAEKCVELRLTGMNFPNIDSLTLQQIDFENQDEILDILLKPFLPSPLQRLHIDDCFRLPESFSTWLDPSMGRWPRLERLSLRGVDTQPGPGDSGWDEANEEEREGWDHLSDSRCWASRPRITLESHCVERNIEFDANDWIWFRRN